MNEKREMEIELKGERTTGERSKQKGGGLKKSRQRRGKEEKKY